MSNMKFPLFVTLLPPSVVINLDVSKLSLNAVNNFCMLYDLELNVDTMQVTFLEVKRG